jgi:hypothetical protein
VKPADHLILGIFASIMAVVTLVVAALCLTGGHWGYALLNGINSTIMVGVARYNLNIYADRN